MRWCRIWLGHAAFHHRSGVSCPCESPDSLVLRYDSIRWVNYARWSISGAGMLDKWGRLMCICRVASACRECIRWHLSKLEDIWIASADKLLGAPRRPSKYLNSSCFGQRAQLTYRIAHHIYTFKPVKCNMWLVHPTSLGYVALSAWTWLTSEWFLYDQKQEHRMISYGSRNFSLRLLGRYDP